MTASLAPPHVDESLSELAGAVAGELGVVGAQIALLKDGEVRQGVTGLANLNSQAPVTPDTLFQIGSTTKMFTAALVMQLVEEGAIGLDTPVVEQLPGFLLSDEAALRVLTPRHLMSMSSGIDNGPYTDFGRGDGALTRYVASLAELPHLFPPGEGYGYSNASTVVSGRLISHVTGGTWEDALRTRLLEPAQLVESANFPEDVIWRRFALGYDLDATDQIVPVKKWSLPRSIGPAGGTMCTSAGDLARFAHLFMHEGRSVEGIQILSARSVESMQAHVVKVPPTLLAEWWGLGPYGKVWDGVEVMGHSGTQVSGSSYLLWARERGVAIATTVNVPELGYPFAAAVFKTLFKQAAGITVPPSPTPPVGVEVDAQRLVGKYAMWGVVVTVEDSDEGITISSKNNLPDEHDLPPSLLIPLTPTTFLPSDPRIDGRRGWALTFVGADAGPATHLLSGFFCLRRVA